MAGWVPCAPPSLTLLTNILVVLPLPPHQPFTWFRVCWSSKEIAPALILNLANILALWLVQACEDAVDFRPSYKQISWLRESWLAASGEDIYGLNAWGLELLSHILAYYSSWTIFTSTTPISFKCIEHIRISTIILIYIFTPYQKPSFLDSVLLTLPIFYIILVLFPTSNLHCFCLVLYSTLITSLANSQVRTQNFTL